MASDSRGRSSGADNALANDMSNIDDLQHDTSDMSESGSSYIGSGMPSPPATTICPWRTDRFHDQECERFFDCPTHIVERCLSEHELDRAIANDNGGEGPSNSSTQQGPPRDTLDEPSTVATEFTEARQDASSSRDVTDASHGGDSTREEGLSHMTSTSTSILSSDNTSREASEESGGGNVEEEVESSATPSDVLLVQPPPRISSLQGTQLRARESIDGTNYPLSPNRGDEGEGLNVASSSQQSQPPRAPVRQPLYSSIPTPRRTPTFTRLEDIISSMSEPRAAPRIPQQPPHGVERRANQELPAPPRDILLPRWQPDNEVTFCPICRTQFSIFVRKHHCRKCGRVVCNSCSPHRIVIPYQFIVQPPGQPRQYPSFIGGDDFNNLGGGERVRLCNPCVPDPNTTPPQMQGQGFGSPYSPRSPPRHNRSHSSSNRPGVFQTSPGPLSPLTGMSPLFSSRNRSVTVAGSQSQYPPVPGLGAYGTQYLHRSREDRILSGTPPTSRSDYLHSSEADVLRHMHQNGSLMDVRVGHGSSSHAGPSSSTGRSRYYQIPEEDECPVCHRELPSRSLPDAEALRESHITMCIQSHSHYGYGGPSSGTDGSPLESPGGMGIRRPTGMFPYRATEKDCVDSAECTICLEEFEVGVPMARLECLCRFHRACIMAWWKNHPGRCPVHQHDAFGF